MTTGRVLAGAAAWTAVGKYTQYATQLVVTAVLARLLSPEDFGVVGMVVAFTGFVNILAEGGVTAAVVQRAELDDRDLSTAFWCSLGIASVLAVVTYLAARPIEAFFGFPDLAAVVRAMALGVLLLGLAAVPSGRLRRRLRFRRLAVVDVVAALSAGVAAVVLASMGWGYWALVAWTLITLGLKLLLLIVFGRWLPRAEFRPAVAKRLLGFSSYVVGFGSVNYWARNADNLLVGRFMGAAQLGLYSQAYLLMMVPVAALGHVIGPALHPVLAGIRDRPRQMAITYFRAVEALAMVCLPLGCFLVIFAGPVIRVLWGTKWVGSIPVFEVLAILTVAQPIVATSAPLFMAADRARLLFGLGAVNAVAMVCGILVGLPYGIVGVASGYAVAWLGFVLPVTLWFVLRTLESKLGTALAFIARPLGATLVLALLLYGFRQIWADSLDDRLVVAIGGGVTALWIAGLTLSLYGPVLRELLRGEAPAAS